MSSVMGKSKITSEKQWTDVFPMISTASDSYLFIKRLTALTIPTILFMRKILPRSEFESQIFEGMTLMVLKKNTSHSGTGIIKTWLMGAFDALKNKYLKNIALEVKDAHSDLTLEIYTITIRYDTGKESISIATLPGDEVQISFRNSEENMNSIQFQTVRFLQMCYSITKSCSALPRKVTLSMKLSYHENTPLDYEPSGFKQYIPTMPIFAKKTRSVEIGFVNTTYHSIEFFNKTCLSEEGLLPKVLKLNNSIGCNREFTNSKTGRTVIRQKAQSMENETVTNKGVPLSHISILQSNFNTIEESTSIETKAHRGDYGSQSLNSDAVRCPCLSQMTTSIMYQCSECKFWVHAECFGIHSSSTRPPAKLFYCHICYMPDGNCEQGDAHMTKLTGALEQQKLAVKRRLLSFLRRSNAERVTFQTLREVSGNMECQHFLIILKEMMKSDVIRQYSGRTYSINKNELKSQMCRYFHLKSSDDTQGFSKLEISDSKRRKLDLKFE